MAISRWPKYPRRRHPPEQPAQAHKTTPVNFPKFALKFCTEFYRALPPITPSLCRPAAWACLWRRLGASSNLAYTAHPRAA